MDKREKRRAYQKEYALKHKERLKKYRSDNKERISQRHNEWVKKNQAKVSEYQRAWRYGLTVDEMRTLLEDAGDTCQICLRSFDENKAIDHCHTTGKVRGVICNKCNFAIGLIEENTDTLKRAIKYLDAKP